MVDSLAIKMQNLAISPINYNSNQTNSNQVNAIFTNLQLKITDLYINNTKIHLKYSKNVTNNPRMQIENNYLKQEYSSK